MKIEKGKLYYDTVYNKVMLCKENIDCDYVNDKIAVHCPTKEDVEYLKSNLLDIKVDPFEDYYPDVYIQLDSPFTYCSKKGAVGLHYHIITIDQLKEFYPEDKAEYQTDSIEWNKSVFNPQPHYDNTNGSLSR